MINRFYLSTFFICFLLLKSSLLFAQEEDPGQGEIEDVQVEIVKDREIVLPPAVRKYDKIPPQSEQQERPDIQYKYIIPRLTFAPLDLRLRPLRIKDEPLQKTYGNYIAAGFGNFVTPYVEAYINSKRDKSMSYGAHAKYLSSFQGPVDQQNSANGEFEVDMFGSYYGRKATLSGDLGFRRRNLYFYGYPEGLEVERDTIKQHYNHIFAEGILASADVKSPWDYTMGLTVDYLSDNLENNEVNIGAAWDSRYNLNNEAALEVNFTYDFINYSNTFASGANRHVFRVQPRVSFSFAGVDLEAGLNAAYENDTLGTSEDLHIYPYAKAEYQFMEGWDVYALLDGDIERVTYRELTYENPFLGPLNQAFHNNRTFNLSGGIKGNLLQKIGVEAGFQLQAYKNMHFFLPADQQPTISFYDIQGIYNRYAVIYDAGTTNVFSLFGQATVSASDDLYANFRAQWFSYNTDFVEEAYHRPTWIIESDLFYNIYDKINLNLNFVGMGGIASINDDGENFTLDPALDLSVKADYLLSDRASFFIQLNNIFAQEYQLLHRYPVRGFQIMGGITYNF